MPLLGRREGVGPGELSLRKENVRAGVRGNWIFQYFYCEFIKLLQFVKSFTGERIIDDDAISRENRYIVYYKCVAAAGRIAAKRVGRTKDRADVILWTWSI